MTVLYFLIVYWLSNHWELICCCREWTWDQLHSSVSLPPSSQAILFAQTFFLYNRWPCLSGFNEVFYITLHFLIAFSSYSLQGTQLLWRVCQKVAVVMNQMGSLLLLFAGQKAATGGRGSQWLLWAGSLLWDLYLFWEQCTVREVDLSHATFNSHLSCCALAVCHGDFWFLVSEPNDSLKSHLTLALPHKTAFISNNYRQINRIYSEQIGGGGGITVLYDAATENRKKRNEVEVCKQKQHQELTISNKSMRMAENKLWDQVHRKQMGFK